MTTEENLRASVDTLTLMLTTAVRKRELLDDGTVVTTFVIDKGVFETAGGVLEHLRMELTK